MVYLFTGRFTEKVVIAVLWMNRELEPNPGAKGLMHDSMSAYIVPKTMHKVSQQLKDHWLKGSHRRDPEKEF